MLRQCFGKDRATHRSSSVQLLQDHFQKQLKRNQAKLDGLQCLGDANASFCGDQRRCVGHSEVYLEQLAVGGNITALTALDRAHLACASTEGQIWVYNWREDRIVSQLRSSSVVLADEDGNPEVCRVRRMQTLTEDARVLGSTDERGMVCLWDLFDMSMIAESRFHEKACTSIKPDYWRRDCCVAFARSSRTSGKVRERFLPPPRTCGNGVPNTCLGLGGDRFPNLLITGGADGKLRIWDQCLIFLTWLRQSISLKRMHTIQIGSVLPTQAFTIGWQVIISASFGDSSYSGMRPVGA
eukprot:g30607.t1